LRSLLAPPFQNVQNGGIQLDETPGIGVTPDLETLEETLRQPFPLT
jgi:L-alanine-DL-glutamate epimerase-like enolase superfamily enzyme